MRESGFTLLEVVIAMTLFAVVAVIIGMSMRLSIGSWERADRGAADIQKMRSSQEIFARYLRAAFPYSVVQESSKKLLFRGSSDELRFACIDGSKSVVAFQWCAFRIADRKVLLACFPLPDKKALEHSPDAGEELLAFRTQASFEYYLARTDSWQSSWDDETQLPAAVRISVDDAPPVVITLPMGNTRATIR